MQNSAIVQLVITFLLFNFASTSAQETKGNYTTIEIPAPSLKNNLVGTDTIQKIGVYLPPSYSTSNKSYPVVYFLHGYTGKVRENYDRITDIMENKTAQEMIYVEISGYNFYKGSYYQNSPVTGNWEDYVTHDVIAFMDKNYRTIKSKDSRGLTGHSMGGQGAFNISLKHPDKFSAIYLISPGIAADDDGFQWLFPNGATINSLKILSDKMKNTPKSDYTSRLAKAMGETGNLWIQIAYGVAFAPDTSQPMLMASPFIFHENGTYEKNDSIVDLWKIGVGNLTEKVKIYKENLKLYNYYAMEVGYKDQVSFIVNGLKQLSNYMWEEKIPHSTYFHDGDHTNRAQINLENRIMPLMSIYLKGE